MTARPRWFVGVIAGLAVLASCRQVDKKAIRAKAVAIVRAHPRKPVVAVPPACPPDGNLRGMPDCPLTAVKRTGQAGQAQERMAVMATMLVSVWRELRDPIAAGVVDDPTLVDRLVVPLARHVSCPQFFPDQHCDQDPAVPGVEAEIENALTATLANALSDGTYRDALNDTFNVWHAPGAFSELEKLNDSDCTTLIGAAQDVRGPRIRAFVLAALRDKPAKSGSGSR